MKFINSPFLLVGEDFEGISREIGARTMEQAREIAAHAMTTDNDGPGWRGFEIWGNHPVTKNWEVLETSDTKSVVDSNPKT